MGVSALEIFFFFNVDCLRRVLEYSGVQKRFENRHVFMLKRNLYFLPSFKVLIDYNFERCGYNMSCMSGLAYAYGFVLD